ncbi:MAG: iron ABC transporter permease, partial [Actinobacteria bacterium]|nr:iron ABC transporter permease [Actinomycetota bacterium]
MRPRSHPRAPGSILLLASAAVVTAALLLPLAYLVIRAVSGGSASLDILDGRTARIVLDTVILVVVVCAASLAIGVPLAWLLTSTDLPYRRALTVAATLPLVLPSYVASLALLGVFGPRGFAQQALEPLGVDRLPDIYGLVGASAALTLSTYPYVLLLAMAGFRSLDPSLVEAARSLGVSRSRLAFRVVLPALRPSLTAASLLVALYTLADFGAVALMQYPSLTRAVYLQYTAAFDRSAAATLGLVLIALSSVALLADALVRRRARYARTGPGAGRRRRTTTLGAWRLPALGFVGLVVAFFLVVPLGVLVWWTVKGIQLGHPLSIAWEAALRTLQVSIAAAIVAVAAAIPVALFVRRRPSFVSRALERACFASNALPGIVIALSLVFFGARYGGSLYQSTALLVFAYVVRFQPEALAGVSASLVTVSTRLEEAARGLGRSAGRSFLGITVRLALPGVLVGAALVFLSVMKELPATLLLKP